MKSRCPRSVPLGPALLEGYRLAIALPANAPAGETGWATVTPREGASVPGGLFRLHADDLPGLDRFEDFPTLYHREHLEVSTATGAIRAMLYVMREPLRPARPTAEYAATIREGYRNFGLPTAGLERVLRGG